MPDTILTLKQIEDLFRDLTLQLLGLDPADPANTSRVRIGWPTKGSPAWKINENVTFLLVNFDDDSITRQTEISYDTADEFNAGQAASSTRVLRVNWIAYGPSSFDDMDAIRGGLYLPEFSQLLAANNIALILEVPVPVRSPELFNGQWWERTSFYARFNEKVVRRGTVPYIQNADIQTLKG